MAIWVSSDWHCQPGELKQNVRDWIKSGKENNHRLICAGDLFDILPLGKDKWQDAPSIKELVQLLDGYPLYYVTGNHDPYNIMTELMAPYINNGHDNIHIYKELTLPDEFTNETVLGTCKYFIVHGHKWSVTWGFLGLRHIAPWIVEKMVDIAPGLWRWFCKKMGWLASEQTPQASGYEEERITPLTRIVWERASDHAIKNKTCVILGHTHTTGRRERGVSKNKPTQTYMADGGNLGDDGSYIEITDNAEVKIRWLN